MSTSIVTIDQGFGVIHRLRWNHILFTQPSPNSCAICLIFWLTASKCFTSTKLLFTIFFSTEETIWNEISQINVATIDSNFNWVWPRRVFRCKNEWEEHKCWRQKDQKRDFYKNEKTFKTDDIDANKILVWKEKLYGINGSIKFFIGYSDNDAIRPLWIMLPQMIGYAKHFESNAF